MGASLDVATNVKFPHLPVIEPEATIHKYRRESGHDQPEWKYVRQWSTRIFEMLLLRV
jgi:hypothetical protein